MQLIKVKFIVLLCCSSFFLSSNVYANNFEYKRIKNIHNFNQCRSNRLIYSSNFPLGVSLKEIKTKNSSFNLFISPKGFGISFKIFK